MKKSLATLTFTALALSAMLIPGLMSRYSASAESKLNSSQTSMASAASFAAQNLNTGIVMPSVPIYALNTTNTIFILRPGETNFSKLVRVTSVNGNLIGIDFRPADGRLYAVTTTGAIYTIALDSTNLGAATKVSDLSPRFHGGYQSLMDFNPVVNALRLIGSNDSNYAVVNSNGGNLNSTVVQTNMTYPAGDVNAGKNPHITAGAYTNNRAGATVTLFYGIDYALDTFVTIPPATAGGSSATGGGQLQTIGPLVTPAGARVNFSPLAGIDIVTNTSGANTAYGTSGETLFTIDLAQINKSLPRGQTQNVVVRGITLPSSAGAFVDIAIKAF